MTQRTFQWVPTLYGAHLFAGANVASLDEWESFTGVSLRQEHRLRPFARACFFKSERTSESRESPKEYREWGVGNPTERAKQWAEDQLRLIHS